jgi:predicted DNA-binding transcriptional regulator AlpA
MKILDYNGLREKGITLSRSHIARLIRENKFPKPAKVGGLKNFWPEAEIDAHIESIIRDRDAAAQAA